MTTLWTDAIRDIDTSAARLSRRRSARGLEPSEHFGEAVEKRTLCGKTYWLGGDRYRLIHGLRPVHVPLDVSAWLRDRKTYTGGWADIDPSWSVVNGQLESGVGWYRVTVDPAVPCAMTYASLIGGSMSMQMTGLDLRPVAPEVFGKGLRWQDVAEDFDVELHLYPHGVEWFKRLKSDRAPRSWSWDVEQSADFTPTIDWTVLGWDNADRVGRTHETMARRRHQQAQVLVDVQRVGHRTVAQETVTGRFIALEPVTRIKTLTDAFVYPVWVDLTINEAIVASQDDGEEIAGGINTWNVGGTVPAGSLLYGNELDNATYPHYPGWRFVDVAIGNGDTVGDPTVLKVVVTDTDAGGVTGTIRADTGANRNNAFSDSARPSQITSTTATINNAFTSTGLHTIDVKAIVQELVNLGGGSPWVLNDDMRFCALNPTGTGAESARTDDLDTTSAPGAGIEALLDIEYTTAGGGGSTNRLRRRMLMGLG